MTTTHSHRIVDPEQARAYAFAGKAIITLVSEATGARFTYKIRESKDGRVSFVSYLRGADNCSDYSYIGFIRPEGYFIHGGQKAKAGRDAPVTKAIQWALVNLAREGGPVLPGKLQFWHEGRCGRCGRRLTVPESIATGLGPHCAATAGVKRVGPTVAKPDTPASPSNVVAATDQEMARAEAEG